MTEPPPRPKIYHITHGKNLAAILADGELRCDAHMAQRGGPSAMIGFSHIKQRRFSLPVKCYPDDRVSDYVPFYFCPRSVMLYVIHRGTQPDLDYRGGQEPILHLESDLHQVLEWAAQEGRRWAFTSSNAGAGYALFWNRVERLDQVNWEAVAARDWRAAEVKEGKQAEFLVHGTFPLTLVSRIGVRSMQIQERVEAALAGAGYSIPVQVRPEWYY